MYRSKALWLAAIAAAAILIAIAGLVILRDEGCRAYTRAPGPLIAHAGGGLPDRFYANDREALDLSVKHGHRLIELDFIERGGALLIGHDEGSISTLTVPQLMAWLDAHPSVSIVTDVKTDNLSGLALLKRAAAHRLPRIIPQIYDPAEHDPVVALGYPRPILTIYKLGDDGWQQQANALPLRFVTMPANRRDLASGIRHPVFLHTVNHPIAGFGLYTDCLIPE